jgi:hypothetical protein
VNQPRLNNAKVNHRLLRTRVAQLVTIAENLFDNGGVLTVNSINGLIAPTYRMEPELIREPCECCREHLDRNRALLQGYIRARVIP